MRARVWVVTAVLVVVVLGGLAAFSEKRSGSRVYFCTGMGGCLQTVLYGFGGLNVAWGSVKGRGTLVAKGADAALFADPHLPHDWNGLVIKGIKFSGSSYTISVSSDNNVNVKKD